MEQTLEPFPPLDPPQFVNRQAHGHPMQPRSRFGVRRPLGVPPEKHFHSQFFRAPGIPKYTRDYARNPNVSFFEKRL